jgi:hypothetical protein
LKIEVISGILYRVVADRAGWRLRLRWEMSENGNGIGHSPCCSATDEAGVIVNNNANTIWKWSAAREETTRKEPSHWSHYEKGSEAGAAMQQDEPVGRT